MRQLYPPVFAADGHYIEVGDGHRVHVDTCGNPSGKPVLFIHGGPGSGCTPEHRRYFDPARYRVILIDQRGCGRSTPLGETRANTTRLLVQDLENIRQRLDVPQWILFGGSWGATLALCYAQTRPDRVSAMVLRGTFLAREVDLEWFFGGNGTARIFPDAYDAFVRLVPADERAHLIGAYHRRIHGSDEQAAIAWARSWTAWGDRVATWTLSRSSGVETDTSHLLAKARIETHYAVNRYFLSEQPLLATADKLPDVPITIVHGRRDLVCPFESAWALHQAIPDSRLVSVPDAGHLASEPSMIDALVAEMDRLCRQDRPD